MARYSKEWVETDASTHQFGRQLSEFLFEFKEDGREQEGIDLTAYRNGEIENCINAFGYTIMGKKGEQDLHQLSKDEKNWLIAECIFETNLQPKD